VFINVGLYQTAKAQELMENLEADRIKRLVYPVYLYYLVNEFRDMPQSHRIIAY